VFVAAGEDDVPSRTRPQVHSRELVMPYRSAHRADTLPPARRWLVTATLLAAVLLASDRLLADGVVIDMPPMPQPAGELDPPTTYQASGSDAQSIDLGELALARYAHARTVPLVTSMPCWGWGRSNGPVGFGPFGAVFTLHPFGRGWGGWGWPRWGWGGWGCGFPWYRPFGFYGYGLHHFRGFHGHRGGGGGRVRAVGVRAPSSSFRHNPFRR
jgi:hypothetical protein